jgi:aryl-alcohol dehydrogenase-like predicted oxidoreductase
LKRFAVLSIPGAGRRGRAARQPHQCVRPIFAPLVRGLLAGSLMPERPLDSTDVRTSPDRFPRAGPDHPPANAELATVVAQIAEEHGSTPAQIALAWLLGRRPWIVPIPGTKNPAYVEDNAGAPDVQLSPEDEQRLERPAARVQGARYGSAGRLPTWVSPPLQA